MANEPKWEQVAELLNNLRETCKSYNVTPADWMTALIAETMQVAMSIDANEAPTVVKSAIDAYVADYMRALDPCYACNADGETPRGAYQNERIACHDGHACLGRQKTDPPSGRRPFGRPCVENDRCGLVGCQACDT